MRQPPRNEHAQPLRIACAHGRTVCPPALDQADSVVGVRGTAAHAALVQDQQHRLGIRATVAAKLGQHLLHLVEVEHRVLEVLVEHADVGAVDDGVKRPVLLRPLNEAASEPRVVSA